MSIAPQKSVKDVVTDFLVSAPTLEELANYRLPDDLQTYAHTLLEKNRLGTLNADEQREMTEFRFIDHLLTLVKVKALLKLKSDHE
jgi:hypothetical protein